MKAISEADIIKELLENPNTHYLNDYFAYIPMRLTGLGLAERIIDNKAMIFNRTKENFATDDFMKIYASVPICIQHPTNENGEFEPLGFKHSSSIIGNAIHSFLRDDEIWVIARIHDDKAVCALLGGDYSTSPYFISKEVQHEIENDVIYNEIPLICNHLAIVDKGFWDKKITDKNPISKEQNMSSKKVDSAEVEKIDTEAEKVDTDTETKADNAETETKADSEAEKVDTQEAEASEAKADTQTQAEAKVDSTDNVSALIDKINTLKAQVDSLLQAQDTAKSDEELQEKDEVIEAINEIADSSDIVERVRARVGDSAKDILQKFLKVNKKHVSEKYHALVDSIPNNAYSLAKNDILEDVRKNLAIKNQVQNTYKTSGWQLNNGEIMGYKF